MVGRGGFSGKNVKDLVVRNGKDEKNETIGGKTF